MKTTPSLRIVLATLTTVTLWLTPWTNGATTKLDAGEVTAAPVAMQHTFSFRSEADEALTEWALTRFEYAGLQLPPLAIAFYDNKESCNGNYGLYRPGTPAHVDICAFNRNRFLMFPKKTILHELGHAWAHHTLTEETRQKFLGFRGLDTWRDESTPWEQQGTEHAAEIIAWALIDEDLHLTLIQDADPRTLANAYRLLTATQHPTWGRTPVNIENLTTGTAQPHPVTRPITQP